MNILSEAKNLKTWAIKHRRHLHQYPELSLQEQKTSEYCQKIMHELGYTITPSFGYGFCADLDIPNSKETIAFRAEMDALPIQEQNTHDYTSKNAGVAHMCGHDVHMTIALTTAKLLSENKDKLIRNIHFIFQPNEEEVPGGARAMIEAGCLNNVKEIYGLHTTASAPVGTILIREGTLMATSNTFTAKITGKGCHAAKPSEGLNPIPAAASIIQEWQQIPDEINENPKPILSITKCNGGNTNNVIPENIELGGTIRCFDDDTMLKIKSKMEQKINALKNQGFKVDLQFIQSYHCVVNQAYGVKRVVEAAKATLPTDKIKTNIQPFTFVEDFCYYLQNSPGAFYLIGAGNADKNIKAPLHSNCYDVDEDVIVYGSAIMATLALL